MIGFQKDKVVNITLKHWDYKCADGCCHSYGTEILLNGKECGNQWSGEEAAPALLAVLKDLGYDVNVEEI
jgi:hypothetical protein